MKHLLVLVGTILLLSACKKNCNEYHLKMVNNGAQDNFVAAGITSPSNHSFIVRGHSDTTIIIDSKVDSIYYQKLNVPMGVGYKVGDACDQSFDVTYN